MEKRILKKSISLVLALCMLISLLPAVSFAAGTAKTVYFANFSGVYGSVSNLSNAEPEGIDYMPQKSTAYTTTATQRLGGWGTYVQIATEGTAWKDATGNASQVMFTVDLGAGAAAGWYQIEFTGGNWYPASDLYIYANDTYVGDYIPKKDVDPHEMGSTKTYGAVYLEPDENGKVEFKVAAAKMGVRAASGSGSSDAYWEGRILLSNLSLTYLGAKDELGYDIAHNIPSEITVGEVLGKEYSAYIDAGDGIARTMNGISSTRTANGDFFKVEVLTGESIEFTSVVADGIATGKVIPKSLGETTLKITASLGGVPFEKTHTVNVVEAIAPPEPVPVTVDFTEATIGNASYPTSITSEEFSVVADETGNYNGSTVRLVTIGSSSAMQIPHKRYDNDKFFWATAANETKRKDAQFTIRVPLAAPGYYTLDVSGFKYGSEGSEYYVYADDKYAGYVSFYGGAKQEAFTNRLNTLYLEPDADNTVKIMFATAANPAEKWINILYLQSLKLTPVENQDEFGFGEFSETLPEKIYIGEPVDFTATAVMNNGSVRKINGYTSAAAEDAGNYITASVKSGAAIVTKTSDDKFSDGVYAGTLAASAPGDIVITISTRMDGGDVIERDFTVRAEYPPKLSTVKVALDKASIPVSRTAKASLTLTRDDESLLPEDTERTIEYSAAPEGVVTVSQDGTVTAIGEGTATITAKVITAATPDGVTGTATINVTAKPTLESIVLSAISNAMIVNSEKELTASATMSDSLPGDISKYTLIFTSSDETVAIVSNTGVVTAKSAGNALITASATGENGLVTASFAVTVYDGVPETVIDFTQTVVGEVTDQNGNVTYPYSGNSPGYTVTYPGSNTFRKYAYSDSGRQLLHVSSRAPSRRMWPQYPDEKTHTLGIKVNIPVESDYSIVLSGGKWYAGGVYSIFVDGVYAGDHSFWDGNHYESGKAMPLMYTDKPHSLNTMHLSAGEHEILFRTREADYDTPYLLLNTLSFIPVDGKTVLSRIAATLPQELAIGEIFESDAYAEMSDGSVFHFGMTSAGVLDTENTFTATLKGDGAALSGFNSYAIGKSGKSQFTLTGISENETGVTVELSATVGETTKNMTATIPVKDDKIADTTARTEASELFKGDMSYLVPTVTLQSGRVINSPAVTTTYKALTPEIATVDEESGLITALEVDTAKVLVTSSFNGDTVTKEVEIEILPEGMTDLVVTAGGSEKIRLTDIENDTVPLYVTAISNLGNEIDMTGAEVSAEIIGGSDFAEFTDGMNILPKATGDVTFRVRVKTADGRIRETDKMLTVVKGKSRATYMTAEKAEAVRANVKKYDWAKSSAQSYMDAAEKYTDKIDELYDMITSNGVPRGFSIGGEGDPDMYNCRYCNTDIRLEYGSYEWGHDPISRPWKVQCPDCKRLFPSNDFGSFYKLGLNEYGEFDRMRALENHREMLLEKKLIDTSVTEPGKEHSKAWRAYYGYGVKGGYLYNELYDKIATEKSINAGKGLRAGETVEIWGVDDSMGYVPAKDDGTPYTYDNGVVERHTYIAEYMHSGIWRQMATSTGGVVYNALKDCANAYFYTGNVTYGRVSAILLDRLADFYPDYDISIYGDNVWNSDGGYNKGKTIGRIWETGAAGWYVRVYDMVYDMYDDPFVMEYIKSKNKIYKMRHAKETPSQVRTNIEDGILRTVFEGLKDTSISGNFGYPQLPNAYAAVVLDTMPETKEWLDYLMAAGWGTVAPCLGGGIDETLLNTIDADGQGNEGSSYNVDWHRSLITVNEVLDGYDGYSAANLYNNPKFVQMFYSNIPLMSSGYSPQIGDTGAALGIGHWMGKDVALEGWKKLRDPVFAQILYLLNGNSAKGLCYDITHSNPESLEEEVRKVIEEYGEFEVKSGIMTNFGFAALRDGHNFSGTTGATATNTSRDVWMYFGSSTGHGHPDTLNLGMTAFGLNYMPDLGYPETTGSQPNRLQWISNVLSHNTVMVDCENQLGNAEIRGDIKHFDGNGIVRVMDVSTPYVYDSADEYRRSVVYIKADDENSYAVDFFRVLGGKSHLYSFHASSNAVKNTEGLDFTLVEDENGNYISGSQLDDSGNYKGTYVGRDETYIKKTAKDGTVTVRLPVEGETLASDEEELPVEYGPDPNSPESWTYETLFPRGYSWLRNVDRDTEPENKVEIDFEIKDFKKAIKDSKGLGLYMTVLNDGNVKSGADAEISIADGLPPQTAANKSIDKFKYVLIKNEGKNLDTTFTTVLEPYRNERYLVSADELVMMPVSGTTSASDAARAVKVTHVNGRVDYIFYATNNAVTYEVTDGDKTFAFRGFVGVYTLQNEENTMSYIHDGDILCEKTEEGIMTTGKPASIEGVVKSFTKTHEEKNEIVITPAPGSAITADDVAELSGNLLLIDNGDNTRSGTFEIENAVLRGDDIAIDIGRVTPIRQYIDSFAPEKGYIYMIAEGQKARVPLIVSEDGAPVFESVSDSLTVSAGSSISVQISANSPIDGIAISGYEGTTLPRGASLDNTTGKFTWKPDSSQVGENHVAITAVDEFGRESTIHFTITVYGSTTGGSSKEDNTSTDNSGNNGDNTTPSGGGGGGGGGGAAPTPEDSSNKTDADSDSSNEKDSNADTSTNVGAGDSDGPQFTDLSDHVWASDAINALATDGIIKGTTASTYSPASNITRADFALLLVRAFKLESDSTENFADVQSGDYFAPELAIARNTGIVGGIGENKYAPRNNITRQDMMVIVYRALTSLGVEFGIYDEPQYPDFNTVADYARESVSALISAGLVNGKSGYIAPTDYTTRAEVAVLIKRILDYVK